MAGTELSFHIARKSGLEFVFSSGRVLSYPMHTHISVYTITLVRRGTVKVTRPSGARVYQSGDVYVDGPHEPHSPTYGDDYAIVSLCVDKNHFSALDRRALRALCADCASRLVEESPLGPEEMRAILTGLEDIYARLGSRRQPRMFYPPAVNRFNFLRRFKKQNGLTPHQFQVQSQVRRAKRLLSSLSIAEAALEAGFYDQSHLNRWFNKTIGLTPRRYIRACRFLD